MEFISIFFVLLSIVVLSYFLYLYNASKRLPLLVELFFLLVYSLVLLIFLFPNILIFIEDMFGIASAINFIVYLSIFIAYFLIFILYKKTEEQRIEITKLVRELSYIKEKKKKK